LGNRRGAPLVAKTSRNHRMIRTGFRWVRATTAVDDPPVEA